MKKYIVLSVNDNPEYLFYLPLTVWAWRQFGWEPVLFGCNKGGNNIAVWNYALGEAKNNNFNWLDQSGEHFSDYKSETIAQVSRLYAACVVDGMIMTGDVDMIPLSDYWKPEWSRITTYGRDLTDYHYPICYIAMDSSQWMKVMNITSDDYNAHLKRDLRKQANMWGLDQDIITERLLIFGKDKITHVHRGTYPNGYPVGRVDRSAWTKEHSVFIDAHLPRGIYYDKESFAKVNLLLHWVWPNEDFTWFYEYTEKFKQLVNG